MFLSLRLVHALTALNSAALLALAAPLNCTAPAQQQTTLRTQGAPSTLQSQAVASPESCCGYEITNRGNAYFRYQHIVDFSAMASVADIGAHGWKVSDGWQAGAFNPTTKQSPIASRNNVRIVPGEGMAMLVPRKYASRSD